MKLEVVTVLKENKHLAELISKIKEENNEIAKKLKHYSKNKVLLAPFSQSLLLDSCTCFYQHLRCCAASL